MLQYSQQQGYLPLQRLAAGSTYSVWHWMCLSVTSWAPEAGSIVCIVATGAAWQGLIWRSVAWLIQVVGWVAGTVSNK